MRTLVGKKLKEHFHKTQRNRHIPKNNLIHDQKISKKKSPF